MNVKIATQLREAIAWAREQGIQIVRGGPWFDWTGPGQSIVACDAVGAVLLKNGLVTKPSPTPETPGYMRLAAKQLDVDAFWLRRFWMGWDREHHVTLVIKEKESEKETKDDVSAFGISLWKEMNK